MSQPTYDQNMNYPRYGEQWNHGPQYGGENQYNQYNQYNQQYGPNQQEQYNNYDYNNSYLNQYNNQYHQNNNGSYYPHNNYANDHYKNNEYHAYPQDNAAGGSSGDFSNLCSLPFVQIKQKVEKMEVLSGYETSNKYAILDPQDNPLMKCTEKSSMLSKLALGVGRSMDIQITDACGAPLMNVTRPFKLYHKNVTITSPSGKPIGTVLKKFAIGKTVFHVIDSHDQQLFTIKGGPFINIGGSRKFSISNSQGTEVGYIQKEWAGFMQEAITDADNFSIHFPSGCSGEARALLIATTLFIDLTHFEK